MKIYVKKTQTQPRNIHPKIKEEEKTSKADDSAEVVYCERSDSNILIMLTIFIYNKSVMTNLPDNT